MAGVTPEQLSHRREELVVERDNLLRRGDRLGFATLVGVGLESVTVVAGVVFRESGLVWGASSAALLSAGLMVKGYADIVYARDRITRLLERRYPGLK